MDRQKFYQQIEAWILEQYQEGNKECFVVGINSPQGAGKTTLTQHLCSRFKSQSINAIAVSIDDFYLTHDQQVALAHSHSQNPFLQQRGYPGTHDIALGNDFFKHLIDPAISEVLVPRYNKSAHEGQGDRYPKEKWSLISKPINIVLFEGWMLGFSPLEADCSEKNWSQVDKLLQNYNTWVEPLDSLLYLQAENPEFVLKWRFEAEKNMRAKRLTGMSDEEICLYAKKFIPAYHRYAETLPPKNIQTSNYLHYVIGEDRLPKENNFHS